MTHRLLSAVVLLLGISGLSACDAGYPNDVADRIEKMRLDKGQPAPTDLPPGLAEDLPQPPPTQPIARER